MGKTRLNIKDEIITCCPICGSGQIELFVKTYDRHYGYFEKYYDVYKCNKCQVLFLNPMITNEELFEMYDVDNYYAYQQFKILNPVILDL